MAEEDPAAIVETLRRHGVKFVVIGAFAAIAQQAPIPATRDIDLTPEATAANLRRLSQALKDLGARIRTGDDEGLAFDHDGPSLGRAAMWNLVCSHGEFDLSFAPSGFTGGYRELAPGAKRVRVGKVEVLVAGLDDVIASKEAAGRAKDLRVLPALYRHRRRLEEGGEEG